MTIDKGAPGDLRTETDVASERLIGRVEHVASGSVAHVHMSEELLAFPSRGWR